MSNFVKLFPTFERVRTWFSCLVMSFQIFMVWNIPAEIFQLWFDFIVLRKKWHWPALQTILVQKFRRSNFGGNFLRLNCLYMERRRRLGTQNHVFYSFYVIFRVQIGYTRKKIQNCYVQKDRNGSAIYLVHCKLFDCLQWNDMQFTKQMALSFRT